MKYYEDGYGLHTAMVVPAGAVELTAEEYAERLAEIRAYGAAHPPEDAPIDEDEIDIDDAEALSIIVEGNV